MPAVKPQVDLHVPKPASPPPPAAARGSPTASPAPVSLRNRSSEQSLLITTSLFGSPGMPYSACFSAVPQRIYIYSSNSRRCREYIARRVACDGSDIGAALRSSLESRFDLVDAEEKLEDAIMSLQSQLLSVRKRRRAQDARARELLGYGVASQEEVLTSSGPTISVIPSSLDLSVG